MRYLAALAAFIAAACLEIGVASAEGVVVSDGWARASIGAAANSVAYMTLTSKRDAADRLIAVATPLAERAELHDHLMEDGVARMRPVDGIDIAPGELVTLEPGGLHIMLMGLTDKLEPGATLPLTLSFEHAGDVSVELPVQPIGHRPKTHQHGDG
ncbi:MAG: copper chaperone PCu(A)C [Alphaproteobacteria bacterium]|nr:copper chaperone PCu(A)C [Alphaproteobacteria bacterium]